MVKQALGGQHPVPYLEGAFRGQLALGLLASGLWFLHDVGILFDIGFLCPGYRNSRCL